MRISLPMLLSVALSFSSFSALAQVPGPVDLQGTGGTVTTQGGDIIHTFTAGGTFTPPPGVTEVEVLVVGGGGGGGSRHGGGGGGGGIVHHTNFSIALPSYSVVIGNGGTSGETNPTNGSVGTNGGNSSFGAMVALGGGGGGSYTAPVPTGGGSGGGGGGLGPTTGGTGDGAGGNRNGGLANQGASAGGTGYGNGGGVGAGPGVTADNTGGGGGGGASVGGAAAGGQFGGAGGAGLAFTTSGSSVFYGGGGGGGSGGNVANIAPGGNGGGGNGGSLGGEGTAGAANTGGGGGGARSDVPGGSTATRGSNGGSGIVIVRYAAPSIEITQEPSAAVNSSMVFAQQPVIELLDGAANPVNGVNITASLASGGGSLGGTLVVPTNGSGQAVFSNLFIAGGGNHTIRFTAAGATAEVVSIVVNVDLQVCPGTSGVSSPVVYLGCVDARVPGENISQQITIPSPAGLAVGNLMIAAVAIDEAHTVNTPAGWTLINQDNAGNGGQAASLAVFYKVATAGDIAANHIFSDVPFGGGGGSTPVQAAKYGWIMYFSGVSGISATGFTPDGGASNPAIAPSVTTTSIDNLILRLGGFDDSEIAVDTASLIAGHTTITSDNSHDDGAGNPNGDSVSGGAAFAVQAGTGATGTANFANFSNNQRWVTMSLALEPLPDHFRISHAGAGTTCAPTTISFRASDSAGNTITSYTGTVNLSTDSGNGSWSIGSGSGTLVNGPGDGTATYTFAPGDNGLAQLSFFNSVAGSTNFNIAAGSIVEDGGFDPNLTVSSCSAPSPSIGAEQCTAGTSVNLGIDSNATNSNRMVILIGGSEGDAAPPGAAATFDGTAMTLIGRALTGTAGFRNMVDIYAILNANLPAAAGSYAANYNADLNNSGEYCVLQLTDVQQAIPTSGAGQPANTTATTGGGNTVTTNITTTENNAVAVSGVSTGGPINSTGRTLTFEWEFDVGGGGGMSFIGSSGIIPAAGATGIQEQFSATPNPARIAHAVASFAPSTPTATEFRISHDNVGAVCGNNAITITAYNSIGEIATDYTGTINLTTTTGLGDWSDVSGVNAVVNGAGNDGAATYTFAPGDNGQVVLGFGSTALGNVNFNVTDGSINESIYFDNDLVMGDCYFRISHSGTSGTCSQEAVTITAVDNAGNTLTAYAGTINLSTDTGNGTWGIGGGGGVLNDGSPGDGDATYTFDVSDAGSVTLSFNDQTQETVNFDVTDGTYSEQAGFDPNLTVGACSFRISHSGTTGTCAQEEITIGYYDADGAPGVFYTGAVNLSTSTGNGSWQNHPGMNGTLTDMGGGDATYVFDAADNGEVTLNFNDQTVETVNINVSDGSSSEDGGFDPDLTVGACEFQITHNGNGLVCLESPVTFSVISTDGDPGTFYTGAVSLSTSTGNGSWSNDTGNGPITPGPGDGTATYQFVSADEGSVSLGFSDPVEETVNINVTDGSISEDAGSDPDLDFASCVPGLGDLQCSNATSDNLTIVSNATNSSRMVLLFVGGEDNAPVTSATFDVGGSNAPMTRIYQEINANGLGNTNELWGILNDDLPAAAGSYTASYTGAPGGATMCLLELTGTKQGFPVAPAVNGAQDENEQLATTGITVPADDSIVISAVGNGDAGSYTATTLDARLWNENPASAVFSGSYGVRDAGPLSVTETASSGAPNRYAHIVAAFPPALPSFRITHDGAGQTCSIDDVTITAYTGAGTVDTGFVGSVDLSTSTGNGYWAIGDGNGTLTPGPGDGTASYTFVPADNGSVTFGFQDTSAETVNINVTDGPVTEDPLYDPDMLVTDCSFVSPLFTEIQCTPDSTTESIDIVSNATNANRIVLLAVNAEGNPSFPTSATFDVGGSNAPMTLVGQGYLDDGGFDSLTEIWAILNDDLPAAAGLYTASHTGGGGDSSVCLLAGIDVEQVVPQPGTPNPETYPVNTLAADSPGNPNVTTQITTQSDNALVLSAVSNGGTDDFLDAPGGTTLDERLWNVTAGGQTTFAGSAGVIGTASLVTVTEVVEADPNRVSHVVASFSPAPAPPAVTDHFRITHANSGGTCTPNQVTITVKDSLGNTVTDYTGTIDLSTSTGSGTWTLDAGAGVFVDGTPGDGIATYQFDDLDDGVVVLNYANPVAGSVNFNVTDGSISESVIFDNNMVIGSCELRISHDGNAGTCTPESVTLSAVDGAGNPLASFTGTINLSTTTGNGTWSLNTGNGTFNDPSADDGMAAYTFDASDNGVVVLNFSDIHEEVVNFNASGGGLPVSSSYDPDLTVESCAFRITHSGSADQCTPESITITAVDDSGATLTGFAGTINLSTDTGNGTWSVNTGAGVFDDPVSEDGAASYIFDPSDNGEVVLDFLNTTTEVVNINVTSGSINEDPLFDPDLTVDPCSFRISVATGTLSACTFEAVTIGVYDSGGALAVNYAGTVEISTDTANGNWVSTAGAGTLTDVNPNDGVAAYAFDISDGGTVDIVFSDETVETVNINLNDNGIVEDPGFDPSLDVTACLPVVTDVQCYANQNQANAVTLSSSAATGASRMVLMYTSVEDTTAATNATLDGGTYMLTELKNEAAIFGGAAQTLQVFGILDTDLPSAAGTYSAQFTGNAGSAMCLVALEGVAQAFPVDNGDSTGQLNGSNAQNTQVASTAVTAVANNSIILSVVANGQDGTSYTSTLENVLWPTGVADANSSDWAGHSAAQPTTGLLTVDETNSGTPNRHAHIVMALAPIVSGSPYAADYVPVTLFQTFSGNINYRTAGFSLRDQPNGVDACSFVPVGTGSTADLIIPGGSSIVAGYLYWSGSGTEAQEDQTVTFGPVGSEISITADDMFHITNAYDLGTDYFTGFKDVTGLISTTATTTYHLSDLTVQTGTPWSTYQGCSGGWGMVVVYENNLENLNIINLFHGFQPFRFSSFQLVPRNFRMATPDGGNIPNGQITHLTFEGDDSLNEPGELLELQNDPDNLTFTALVNSVNPALSQGGGEDAQYNDTITHPAYDGNLDFLPTGGDDGQGYIIDSTSSYGTDLDTYYLQGANPGEILYPFGSSAAEQITTRYGSGQDGVLLVGEFISVTNAPIADLEVFISESGTFKVDSSGTGMYSYTVANNGNGALTGGFADGDVVLTINLPVGMTAASINSNGWSCTPDVALPAATAFTCVFDIVAGNVAPVLDNELDAGESLPDVEITVNLDDEASYPLVSNPVTQSARIAHIADYVNSGMYPGCVEPTTGVQPDPTMCPKAPQFDNVNDLNKNSIDIDDLDEKSANNNNVVQQLTNVSGIITNLSITKSVVGVLEENQPAQYQLVITNLGPDVTSKTMTVTDTLPGGLVPDTALGADWSCNIVSQDVTCIRTIPLGVGASTTLDITTVSVVSPAIEGAFVSNTAVVQAGTYNFDQVPGNNSDTEITEVVGEPVASNEKFLITVNETSTIGGLGPFNDGDLVLYDPVADEATMFLAESSIPGGTDLGNVDALHLLPNGHLLISSADDNSEIAGVDFDAEDIVLYDPILQTATLIFDGSTIFDADTADVDAVHVVYNDSFDANDWDIIISTTDDASIAAVNYDDNDLISYDVSAGTASLLIDGASGDVFNGDSGDIDAAYRRFDDPDLYVLSTDDASTTIGINGTQDTYSHDDLVEIDLATPGSPDAGNVFLGDVASGVFTPTSGTRKLNGVHVIEDGYYGHFAIVHGGSGDTCTPTTITIRRHGGLTHTTDSGYTGSILITNDIADGTWTKDVSANGTIDDMGGGGGAAIYTFDPADNGEVILYLTQTSAATMNVDVTNFFNEESDLEDNDVIISDVVTNVSYLDQFSMVAYNNNDGIASFASAWDETNDDDNPGTGAIRIVSNRLSMTNPGGSTFPEILRTIDFSGYTPNTVSDPLTLTFNWNRTNGAPADTFAVEARSQDSGGWTSLQTFTGFSGAVASTPVSIDLTAQGINPTSTTQIRFVLSAGYQLERFNIDNVQVTTATNDCNVGDAVDHYAISHVGFGVSCLATNITISPHTVGEFVTDPGPGVTIFLNTNTGLGTWSAPLNGTPGAFSSVPGTGQATYQFQLGENSLVFPFNYTAPVADPESVAITVSDNQVPSAIQIEAPTLDVASAGLRFFNDTNANMTYPTLVSGMDSFLYTGELLTVQAIQVSDDNPAVCEDIFGPGEDVQIEMAFECVDPAACSAAVIPVNVTNNSNTTAIEPVDNNGINGANPGGYDPITLRFETFANGDFDQDPGPGTDFSYTGAQIRLNYADAGSLQIHGRYNIPLLDGAGAQTGNYMSGSGDNNFVIRPFGYDVDVLVSTMPDRQTNGNDADADSWAVDADGTDVFTAGVGFDTTVRAISWQVIDDDGSTGGVANDGIPDPGADLYDNDPTPNYGNEANPVQNDMTVTHALDASMPGAAVLGSLTTNTFTNFGANNGSETHSMAWDEVGIIDLTAALDSVDYLGSGEGITGELLNLGRFVPADFEVSMTNIIDRPLFTPSIGNFTYMGEDFTAEFRLTARNALGATTQNYIGDFAKLDTPGELTFHAIEDIASAGDDIDYSTRLAASATNTFPADFSGDWAVGEVTLSGNLIFSRQASGAEEAPITSLQIALTALDNDDIIDAGRNVDDDDGVTEPGTDLYNLIGIQEFRYGRLRLENAYGSEIPEEAEDADDLNVTGEDLPVYIVAEYYDGTEFVVNTDDVATAYDSSDLDFVAGSYTDNLEDGESTVVASDGVIYQGLSQEQNMTDIPLQLTAPGEGNDGSAVIELDLTTPGLEFLFYDWRGAGDIVDENADGNYTDSPRAYIEFGTFQTHDRIINWQELF